MVKEPSDFERVLTFVDTDGKVRSWGKLPFWVKVKMKFSNIIYLSIGIFYLIIVLYAVFLLPAIKTSDVLLIIIIALIALILKFVTTFTELTKPYTKDEKISTTLEWNFNNLKSEPTVKDHLPLLKALMVLKITERNFKLTELRKKYPDLITEENVIANLYGLHPVSNFALS